MEQINIFDDIKFCDHIEIIDEKYNFHLFNAMYTKDFGICLIDDENERLVDKLSLINSRIIIYYIDGDIVLLPNAIYEINIYDDRFRKRFNSSLQGSLLKYNLEMANKYNLDINKCDVCNYKKLERKYTF